MLKKIIRDRFYSQVYKKYHTLDMCQRAGWFNDGLDSVDYKLYIPAAQTDKIKIGIENPVVLCTTGGFYPIHDGHLYMMNKAKEILEKSGYNVVGGFFSPCNNSYTDTKPNFIMDKYERISYCYDKLRDTEWSVDTYECLYMPCTINFTDVVNRLELYLKKYVDNNIKVAYVFGGDNAEFMYCFENDGIGVCVNRNYTNEIFLKTKKEINSPNCFFIEEDISTSGLSSRNFRNERISTDIIRSQDYYLIRNEGLLPFEHLIKEYGVNKVKTAQEYFISKLIEIFKKYVCDNICVVNLEDQIKAADIKLKGKKTISLDTYYQGTYNVRASRLFNIDNQKKFVDLSFNDKDIKNIPPDNYILVDDDSVSGNTLRRFKERLPENIIIDDIYLMMSTVENKIFDVVDLRDFIVGAKNGGLMIILPNEKNIRAPYIRPFVDLHKRANVPLGFNAQFSKEIIHLNIIFYSMINKNISLKEIGGDFELLMRYLGFNDDDKIIDILSTYKRNIY